MEEVIKEIENIEKIDLWCLPDKEGHVLSV